MSDSLPGGVEEILRSLSTATISDALDRSGIVGQAEGLFPVWVSDRVFGPAFTVRFVGLGGGRGTVGDFIDDVPPAQVVVLDNGGRRDVTVWGDLLTEVARRRGLSGTVIHGVCRDVDRIRQIRYPVFSRGRHMRSGKGRVQAVAVQQTASLGRVPVTPGDLVVGDGDGVVVVPRDRLEEVVASAMEIESVEERIREETRAGRRLDESRASAGYHSLRAPG